MNEEWTERTEHWTTGRTKIKGQTRLDKSIEAEKESKHKYARRKTKTAQTNKIRKTAWDWKSILRKLDKRLWNGCQLPQCTLSPPTDKLSVRSSEHSDQRELGRQTAKQGISARSWALSILRAYFMYSTNKHRRRRKKKMKDINPYVNNISLPWHLRLRPKAQCNTLLYSKNQTCNGQEKRNKQKDQWDVTF